MCVLVWKHHLSCPGSESKSPAVLGLGAPNRTGPRSDRDRQKYIFSMAIAIYCRIRLFSSYILLPSQTWNGMFGSIFHYNWQG